MCVTLRVHLEVALHTRHRAALWALLGLAAVACDRDGQPGDTDSQEWAPASRATLQVSVTDGTSAVEGAWVVLEPSGRDAVTDSAGLAELPSLTEGSYTLQVSADGYDVGAATADVAGDDISVDVTLAAIEQVTLLYGTVLAPSGDPVDGALVAVGADSTTAGADGTYALEVDPGTLTVEISGPLGSSLRPWVSPQVEVSAGAAAEVSVTLPGGGSDAATYVGADTCLACHGSMRLAYEGTAHAAAARSLEDVRALPSADLLEPVVLAFQDGDTLDFPELGVAAHLGTDNTVVLEDSTGATSAAMPVVEVYGGHHAGAALAVEVSGERLLLPFAWSGDTAVLAYPEAFFDGSGVFVTPGAEASYDLRCSGCHSTGHAISEDAGAWSLVPHMSSAVESRVGCEACHGPGSEHAGSTDPDLILQPSLLPAYQQVEVCARCHEAAEDTTHGLSVEPGWPMTDTGASLSAFDVLSDYATPVHDPWPELDAAMGPFDHAGDFRLSPHQGAYVGTCTDCHAPHGTGQVASLRAGPDDASLCTSCHASMFPDAAAIAAHAGHETQVPSCTGCHVSRAGVLYAVDGAGIGELHAHTLIPADPALALQVFDDAGVDTLPLGSVPPNACLDCHYRAVQEGLEAGIEVNAYVGDPTERHTYEVFSALYQSLYGGSR